MAWLLLSLAGLLEIAFAYFMKSSEGFSRPMPAVLTVAFGLASVTMLSFSSYFVKGDEAGITNVLASLASGSVTRNCIHS